MRLGFGLDEALLKASPVLQKKMLRSVELIRKAEKLSLTYDDVDGFFLAFSGGKDSQALYHITELAGVKFKAHFSPTTVDPPQLIRFIRKSYPDCEFGKVTKNIYDMAVEKQILPTMRVRWCCAEYKEMAGAGKVTLIGIRHAESARRAKRNEVEISNRKFSGNFEQFTEWQEERIRKKYKNLNQDQFSYDKTQEVRCINGKDSILVSPIIDWTEADVWEFLNKVCEIPHCELYDKGYRRIGCILCPMASYKQKKKECRDFPYVKEKWIDAIKKIRMGGDLYERIYLVGNQKGWLNRPKWAKDSHESMQSENGGIKGNPSPRFIIPRQWILKDSDWGGQIWRKIHQRAIQRSRTMATQAEVRAFARKQRNMERRWIARQWGLSLMRNLKTKLQKTFSIGG